MQGAVDRFSSFVILARARHTKRLRFAALMAILIAVLLYQTQWLILRPGLAILLAGQGGVVLALLVRNARLLRDLARPAWFEREESFVKRLALFETVCEMVGFLALGYGVWVSTQRLWLALAIGFVYPATVYFGITRRRNLETIRQLRTEAEAESRL